MSSGRSPFTQSAAAATIAPSMQCARRCRSTSRTDNTVSPPISWLHGMAFKNAWILSGVVRRLSVAYSRGASPRSSRRAKRRLFMVRVASLTAQLDAGIAEFGPDRMSPSAQLLAIRRVRFAAVRTLAAGP